LLVSFYNWTSQVYWGSRPVTAIDELIWMAAGMAVIVTIVIAAVRWLPAVCVPIAGIVGLFVSVFVIFAPIKHAQRFVECAQTKQIVYIEQVEREMTIKQCRTRTTLDTEWTAWQWHGGTVK
jgi:hypothetical protein